MIPPPIVNRDPGDETIEIVYNESIPDYGHVMTVAEYKSAVANDSFIDYDGFCNPVREGKRNTMILYPSQIHLLPSDATHVVWYNR